VSETRVVQGMGAEQGEFNLAVQRIGAERLKLACIVQGIGLNELEMARRCLMLQLRPGCSGRVVGEGAASRHLVGSRAGHRGPSRGARQVRVRRHRAVLATRSCRRSLGGCQPTPRTESFGPLIGPTSVGPTAFPHGER
jgi:hypothetical protein